MSDVVLTGISNDIDIDGGDRGRFFLVFNNGELRIPVGEESIEAVLRFRQSLKAPPNDYSEPPEPAAEEFSTEDELYEDKMYENTESTFELDRTDASPSEDEDGVPSI